MSAGAVELHGLDEAALERASNGDRSWFKRHADRAYRIRPAADGEVPTWGRSTGAGRLFAAVSQVRPGTRLRLYFKAPAQPCGCEECAAAIWRRIGGDRGGEVQMALAVAGLQR